MNTNTPVEKKQEAIEKLNAALPAGKAAAEEAAAEVMTETPIYEPEPIAVF